MDNRSKNQIANTYILESRTEPSNDVPLKSTSTFIKTSEYSHYTQSKRACHQTMEKFQTGKMAAVLVSREVMCRSSTDHPLYDSPERMIGGATTRYSPFFLPLMVIHT